MRIARDFARHLLLCVAGTLLTTSLAQAQMGVPDVPTGPIPNYATPAPSGPSTSGALAVPVLWGGLASHLQGQLTWPFSSVAPPTAWFHPAALREWHGRGLPAARTTADRLIRR
jgi:hypothetical protein